MRNIERRNVDHIISLTMQTFSDGLLRKREALLRTISKPGKLQEHGSEATNAKEQGNGNKNLTAAVHRSVRNLLKLGFDYSQIIEGSGVSDAFLRHTFRELSLELPKEVQPDETQKESISTTTVKENTRRIESELRLFMLKTLLELNRVRTLAKQPSNAEQLRQDSTQLAIQDVKKKVFANLQDFFTEIESMSPTKPSSPDNGTPKRIRNDPTQVPEQSGKRLKIEDSKEKPTFSPISEPPTVCISEKLISFGVLLTLSPFALLSACQAATLP